jgi:hypothetical protein
LCFLQIVFAKKQILQERVEDFEEPELRLLAPEETLCVLQVLSSWNMSSRRRRSRSC